MQMKNVQTSETHLMQPHAYLKANGANPCSPVGRAARYLSALFHGQLCAYWRYVPHVTIYPTAIWHRLLLRHKAHLIWINWSHLSARLAWSNIQCTSCSWKLITGKFLPHFSYSAMYLSRCSWCKWMSRTVSNEACPTSLCRIICPAQIIGH